MPDLTPERVAELQWRIGRGIAPASPDALAALNLLLPALLAERERLRGILRDVLADSGSGGLSVHVIWAIEAALTEEDTDA